MLGGFLNLLHQDLFHDCKLLCHPDGLAHERMPWLLVITGLFVY